MHKLKEYVCGELDDLERKVAKGSKLSMSEIQYADTLAHLKKNLMKADEMEGGEYSMRGSYSDGGYSHAGNYVRPDGSYNREIVDSSYARGRGRNASRDSMGRYSSAADDQTVQEVRMLINRTTDDHARHELSKLLDRLEDR